MIANTTWWLFFNNLHLGFFIYMVSRLKMLSVGESGKIVGFDTLGKAYRKKLLAMGLTPGTEFKVMRLAPLGDPVEIKIRGFSLTLRKNEAAILLIEKV